MVKRILGRLILILGWFLFFKVENLTLPIFYFVLLIVIILILRWVIFFLLSYKKYDSITTNSMNFFVGHYSRKLRFEGDDMLIFNYLVRVIDKMNLTIQELDVVGRKISCISEEASWFKSKSKISITFYESEVDTLIMFESITGSLTGRNSHEHGENIILKIKENLDALINSQMSDEIPNPR